MLRHLGLIAVCACIVASMGCNGGKLNEPTPPPVADPSPTVTVQLGGQIVNADAGGPIRNMQVSLGVMSYPVAPPGWVRPTGTTTSADDGTFTLSLNLPRVWSFVRLNLTAPPGYDYTTQRFDSATAAERPAIRMYPTLVIRPGGSVNVRVDGGIVSCGWEGYPCRRILVAASPGDSVELEIVPDDSSEPMALGLAIPENPFILEPDDMSVRRLMVPPGGVPYVLGAGTARLTARR